MIKIRSLETKTQALKVELAKLQKQQLSYYHALLSEGADCRQEGLIWVIKVIWHLGADVQLDKLPRFLDAPAVEFLFRVLSLLLHNSRGSTQKWESAVPSSKAH